MRYITPPWLCRHRYHSLVVQGGSSLPGSLEPIAWTLGRHHAVSTAASISAAVAEQHDVGGAAAGDSSELTAAVAPQPRLIMALAHREQPHWGVQFHPESICTRYGMQLLANFHRLSCKHLGLQMMLPRYAE